MDRGAWWSTVHRVAKESDTTEQLNNNGYFYNIACKLLPLPLCDPMDYSSSVPQVPLFMGFSRQEYQSGLPFPPPRDLPDPGTKPMSPALAGRLVLSHQGIPQIPKSGIPGSEYVDFQHSKLKRNSVDNLSSHFPEKIFTRSTQM